MKPSASCDIQTSSAENAKDGRSEKSSRLMVRIWMLLLFGTLACFLLGTLFVPSTVSKAERRRLVKFPAFSWNAVSDGKYQSCLEDYVTDHLPGRDGLLQINVLAASCLYGAKDQAGFVFRDGHIITVERAIHEDSLDYAANLFARIYRDDLEQTDCHIYFSIVPDKSYFLEKDEYLNMDYEAFFKRAEDIFSFGENVDLRDSLSLEDYYYTDPHWRQEKILDVAQKLASSMHIELLDSWSEEEILARFTGQQAMQTAFPVKNDSLRVLYDEQMKGWTITRYGANAPEVIEVYDPGMADSMDPYSVFLGGSAGMITIENPHGPADRELIVFADSYGSSISPLLASGYGKTTLIDLRNLPSYRLKRVIDFTDQDVLFLYSTSSLNASSTMH